MTCIDSSLDKDVLLKAIRRYYKSNRDKRKNKIMKYKIIYIVAVLIMLNIVFIPFLCNKFWEIGDKHSDSDARSFSDLIEDLGDGYSADVSVPIDGLNYFGGLTCALFIFISALRKSPKACTYGSIAGIGISLYLFYQIYLSDAIWYVGGNHAHLTFGFYISCAGFIAVLIASLCGKNEHTD